MIAFLLALFASSAFAIETHPYTGVSIGPEGKAAPGTFSFLQSVAADPSDGDLYALDTGAEGGGRLYKFDSEGEPLDFALTGTNFIEGTGGSQSEVENQVAVAPPGALGGTAGDIYIANNSEVAIFAPGGQRLGELTGGEFCGVATDGAGHVFVGEYPSKIWEYTPIANPVANAEKSGESVASLPETCNVAVDGNGRTYAANYNGQQGAVRLESLTTATAVPVDPLAKAVAVEPTTNDLYADRGQEIHQYAKDGSLVAKFGENRLVNSHGVSAAGAGGKVYAAVKPTGRVAVFGPLATLPEAVAESASEITRTTAVVHGTLDAANGPEATCRFEYTTQAAFEVEAFEGATSAACSPAGPFSGGAAEPVSAELIGLDAGTHYRFRLVGTNEHGSLGSNENGSASGVVPDFETAVALGVQTGSTAELEPTSTILTGLVNPQGFTVEECFFEYGETTGYGATVPCEAPDAAELGAGTQPVPVQAEATGLVANTGYHFRLAAKNELGTSSGADVAFQTPGAPRISSESISAIEPTNAVVSASIDPDGRATSFYVEYVSQAAFGQGGYSTAGKVPLGGASIGSAQGFVSVNQHLTGLAAGTHYHFRVVASNSVGPVIGSDEVFTTQSVAPTFGSCPNETFRVGPSALLPDCRAYEQATDIDKNGGQPYGAVGYVRASETGDGVTFFNPAGVPGARGAQEYPSFLAGLTGSDWVTQGLMPPQSLAPEALVKGASPNLSFEVSEVRRHADRTVALYIEDTSTRQLDPIVPFTTHAGITETQSLGALFALVSVSDDGEHVFFESVLPLTPGTSPGIQNLFEWNRSTGAVRLVGVLPPSEGGTAPPAGSFGGPYAYPISRLDAGGSFQGLYSVETDANSIEGKFAYFTAGGTGQIYLRKGLDGPSPETVRVSRPDPGVETAFGEELPAVFQQASADGNLAFFTSPEHLTEDSNTGPFEEGKDLYRYDAAAGTLTDLTASADTETENGAEVQGVLGASSDGSVVYFVANGVLAAGATPGDCPHISGTGCNLYRYDSAASPQLTYIARLDGNGSISEKTDDSFDWSPGPGSTGEPGGGEAGRTARVSPDGNVLMFMSVRPLTGYANASPSPSCEEGCHEIFRYYAPTRTLACISCDPTGAPPIGSASLSSQDIGNLIGGETSAARLNPFEIRNMTPDGDRIFFQTPDPLSPADVNGEGETVQGACANVPPDVPACQDVYEWEAAGTPQGSCTAAEVAGGCIYLLSGGQSGEPAYLADVDRSGGNVFLFTLSRLVPSDQDGLVDIYDAKVGGGLASQYPSAESHCAGEACQGAAAPAPPSATPGSSTLVSPAAVRHKANHRKHRRHKHRSRHNRPKHPTRRRATQRSKGSRHGKGK